MEWTMFDRSIVLLAMICGWLIVFFVYGLFKRKSSIYWDDKQQQIKTKSGKCLIDVNKVERMDRQLESLLNEGVVTKIENIRKDWLEWQQKCNKVIEENMEVEKRLEAQLQCGAKGHGKWVYAGGTKQKWDKTEHDISGNETITMKVMSYTAIGSDGFIFKCSDCGLEITKTAKELTATEREALKKLKLL